VPVTIAKAEGHYPEAAVFHQIREFAPPIVYRTVVWNKKEADGAELGFEVLLKLTNFDVRITRKHLVETGVKARETAAGVQAQTPLAAAGAFDQTDSW
jgi:hypothetical protein